MAVHPANDRLWNGKARQAMDPVNRLGRIGGDEQGFSLIMAAVSLVALLGASMLAIDVGQLMAARTQAQNAADAGALAGATALLFNSYTDHSSSGPAVSSALDTARGNLVIGQAPSITPADVAFPTDPVTGDTDMVQTTVYRSSDRGNPIDTLIARFFGIPTVGVWAKATAAARPANAETCLLPWTIPDKWIEKQCPPELCDYDSNTWDPGDTFDLYQPQGNHQNVGAPLANPDVYVPPGQATPATGYTPADIGIRLVLKPNNQNEVTPSFYNTWDIGGVTGGSAYSSNISGCNPAILAMGQTMIPETGNMVGPTSQGTSDLIAQDSGAYWDSGCHCVKGSSPAFKVSPRIRALPLYDPIAYANDQHSGKSQPILNVVNFLGVFVDSVDGSGNVTAYVTGITGRMIGSGRPPTGGFARAIMLVQ